MVLLTAVLVGAWLLGPVGDHASAEPAQADSVKIKGCWRVWVKGTDGESGRTFRITGVTDAGQVEGKDAHGMELTGRFEPAERSWLGHLGILVLHTPTQLFAGYGPDRPPWGFRHPLFSLEPAEMFVPIGPTMAPGVVRPFAMYENGIGRGLTIGAADRLYRIPCRHGAQLAPVYDPEPLGADPPQGP